MMASVVSVDVLTTLAAIAGATVAVAVMTDAWRRRRQTATLSAERDRALSATARLREVLLGVSDLSGADLAGLDLQGAVLREKDLTGADFSRTLLADADLSGADGSRARLRSSDLRNARCRATNFTEADLGVANLAGATLVGAILSRANLRNADLTGADLTHADLSGALLAGADLRGARLDGVTLAGADVSGAKMPVSRPGISPHETPPLERREVADGRSALPVYMAVDVSYSMAGASIGALNQQLADFVLQIGEKPLLADTTWLGVIQFSDRAELVLPLSQVWDVPALPPLRAGGGTSYGPVFRLLSETIAGDVARLKADGYRVHRPIVFFLTDGEPLDTGWENAFAELVSETNRSRPNVVAVGFGGAAPEIVARIGTSAAFLATDEVSVVEALRTVTATITSSIVSTDRQMFTISVPAGFRAL